MMSLGRETGGTRSRAGPRRISVSLSGRVRRGIVYVSTWHVLLHRYAATQALLASSHVCIVQSDRVRRRERVVARLLVSLIDGILARPTPSHRRDQDRRFWVAWRAGAHEGESERRGVTRLPCSLADGILGRPSCLRQSSAAFKHNTDYDINAQISNIHPHRHRQ